MSCCKNKTCRRECSSYSHHIREHQTSTQHEWQLHQVPKSNPTASSTSGNCGTGNLTSEVFRSHLCVPSSTCNVTPYPVHGNRVPTPCGTGNKTNANAMYVNATDRSSVKIFVNGRKREDSDEDCDKVGLSNCPNNGNKCHCVPICRPGC